MARYIDAELLIDKLEEKMRTAQEPYQLTDGEKNFNFGLELATEIAFNMPTADVVDKERYDRLLGNSVIISEALNKYHTADVVEVVRCKDCVNCEHLVYEYDRTEEWWCGAKEVLPDGFCNYGERRDDAEIH